MKKLLALAVTIIAGAIAYYNFLYPPSVLRRATDNALQEFATTVLTKDRGKISASLQKFLADEAKIRLELTFFSLSRPGGVPSIQDFDKASFTAFIDNVLYTLTDYEYRPELKTFELAPDQKTAKITFSSRDWGEGQSFYGGVGIGMRFTTSAECEGSVKFEQSQPYLTGAICKVQLGTRPKPGEMEKLKDMNVTRELMR